MSASVAASNTYNSGTLQDHPVNLPTGITASSLLYVMSAWASGSQGFDPVPTNADYTLPTNGFLNNSNSVGGAVWYREADGNEGSTATFEGGSGDDDEQASITLRIEGWTGTPEVSSTTGSDSSVDFPSLTPSGGSDEYLWICFAAIDGNTAVTGSLANFTEIANPGEPGEIGAWAGYRLHTASSLDPGTLSINASDQWVAWTIAVASAAGGGGASVGRGLTNSHKLARPALVGMPRRPLVGSVRPHLIRPDGRRLAA